MQKRYKVAKKGTNLQTRDRVAKKVQSCKKYKVAQKSTKLQKRYKVAKKEKVAKKVQSCRCKVTKKV